MSSKVFPRRVFPVFSKTASSTPGVITYKERVINGVRGHCGILGVDWRAFFFQQWRAKIYVGIVMDRGPRQTFNFYCPLASAEALVRRAVWFPDVYFD